MLLCNNIFHTLDDSTSLTSSDTNTGAIIGGSVGGVVFLILLVLLCIMMWCFYKKRASYSISKSRFIPVTHYNAALHSNSRYVYELSNMKSNEDLGVEARMCKCLI